MPPTTGWARCRGPSSSPPRASAVPSDDELDALCREHLAPYKVPVGFVTVDDLPRNEIGKVLTKDLLALVPDEPASGA